MKKGVDGLGEFIDGLGLPHAKLTPCFSRLSRLLGILDVDLPVEEVTGEDKSLDVVVDIFNRVNSGGTKLSKGDPCIGQDLRRMAPGTRRHETVAERMGEEGLLLRPRLAVALW